MCLWPHTRRAARVAPRSLVRSPRVAPRPASMTQLNSHAATVMNRLGNGVGILAAAALHMTDEDWTGLAARVDHVRLCGSLVEPLIDWSKCPGATRQFTNDAHAVRVLRRSMHFTRFKVAAVAAQRAGLRLVLNPMSRLYTLDVSTSTLRWVWRAMLAEFDSAAWPTDSVVFEMCNEPGNWNNHSVADGRRFVDLLPQLLALVRATQPSRVMVVGGEMGYRGDHASGTAYVNSGPALVLDSPRLRQLAVQYHLVATFHFYKPRAFTNQGMPEVAEEVARPRWLGNATDIEELEAQFQDILAALNGTVPVYLGEFGVNFFVPVGADAVLWLRTVRALAERRGFTWAFWTYYLSPKAVTTDANASGRLQQWDCSALTSALFERNVEAVRVAGAQSPCGRAGEAPGRPSAAHFQQAVRFKGGTGACNDRRPQYAMRLLAASITDRQRQEVASDPQARAKRKCVIDFRWPFSAGLTDSVAKMCWVARLADAFSCYLLVPPPSVMLSPEHNGGTAVDKSRFWEHYVEQPDFVRRTLPSVLDYGELHWKTITDRMPTREELVHLASARESSRMSAMALEFVSAGADDFWSAGPLGNTTVVKQIQYVLGTLHPPMSCPGKGCLHCPWRPSASVRERSDNARRKCFRDEPFTAIRLRRGDILLPGPWSHYPSETCSSPEVVVKALVEHTSWRTTASDPSVRAAARRNIFVATNEKNTSYLDALGAALHAETGSSAICLESEMAEIFNAPDNYISYSVGIAMAEAASGGVRFHPRNTQLMQQLCHTLAAPQSLREGRK